MKHLYSTILYKFLFLLLPIIHCSFIGLSVCYAETSSINEPSVLGSVIDKKDNQDQLTLSQGKNRELVGSKPLTDNKFEIVWQTVQQRAGALENGIREAITANIPTDYSRAALAIAKRFEKLAVQKKKAGLLAEAVGDLEYIAALCERQAVNLKKVRENKKPVLTVPNPPLDQLTIRDGNFWVNNEPVMLVGAMGGDELESELSSYRDYGFNVIGDDFNAYSSLFKMLINKNEVDSSVIPRMVESWKHLHEMNLAVSYTPRINKIPDWAFEKYPDIIGGRGLEDLPRWDPDLKRGGRGPGLYGRFFPFAIDSSNLKRLVERYYTTLIPNLKDIPGFRVIWLMNEPSYQSCDKNYVQLFRNYLRDKFSTIEALNSAWGADYKGFDGIDCLSKSARVNNFDWLAFHQKQVSDWFRWLSETIKKDYPESILSNKPSAARLLKPHLGIDFEQEALLWDIPGLDTYRKAKHRRYAYDWSARSIMLLDFLKSIAPEKPLADHEFHYVHEPNVSSKYVRTAYFHSYLHGLRMSQFWIWATGNILGESPYRGLNYTAWSQPQVAWGTASAALDLRRLARYIAAFPQKKQVMIYFSRPSLFRSGDAYAEIVTQTYEAANGLDASVGFVSDRMIRNGGLKQCRLLIVAGAQYIEEETRSAIVDFISEGGRVAMTSDSLSKNEYGVVYPNPVAGRHSVVDTLRFDFKNGRLEKLSFQLDKLFEKAGVIRPIRVTDTNGQTAWPIEARAASTESGVLFYLVGLNKQPMKVMLSGIKKITRWKDLMSGENGKGNVLEVMPLDVRLLKLEF